MLNIMIADDHRVLREGLKRIIDQSTDMRVVAEAADGAETLAKASKSGADVVLLDITMPGQDGLETLKQLRRRFPKLRVLILSQHPEDHYAVRALRAGAAGYITKENAASELLVALRKVAAGKNYISESLAERMVTELHDGSAAPAHEKLSDREYEIFCLLGSGKGVSQIGKELSLSVKTISTYRSRILEKMNLNTTMQVILYAMEHKLVATAVPTPELRANRNGRPRL